MLRGLIHFWRVHLAVVLACAVATAVLTGALIVGDSVKGSLRQLTLERLGEIDNSLQSRTFFRQVLADRLSEALGADTEVAAVIIAQGSAVHSESRARASRVGIQGVNHDFLRLFPGSELSLSVRDRLGLPAVVINEALAEELGAGLGDELLLALERPGEAPRETLLGSTDTSDVVRQIRVVIERLLPDSGLGRFSLRPSQELPFVAFVELGELQRALEQEERANVLLVASSAGDDAGVAGLQEALRGVLTSDDLGLEVARSEGWVQMTSRDFVLSPTLEQALESFAADVGAQSLPISTYIANGLAIGERGVPYSSITAFDTLPGPFGELTLVGGGPASPPADDQVLLNEWAARDMAASVGDTLEMTFFEVGAREQLTTRVENFEVSGIVEMTGLAADRRLVPDFPGISDADNMVDWDPPFPVDLSLIRSQDEDYWDEYRATPKAFFALETGRGLWGTRFGATTSMRFAPGAGDTLEELAARLETELPSAFDPGQFGLTFEPSKARGLAASNGATDFRMLFVSFSVFLIASAALLVALFFGLGVEQRASEVGLLLAVGLPLKLVRRRFLMEAAVLTSLGVVLGLGGAVGYAALMMAALRSWWLDAVGTPFLFLHVQSLSLASGAVISFAVALLSILGALRRLHKVPTVALLRGVVAPAASGLRVRRVRKIFIGSSALGIATLVAAFALNQTSSPAFFFTIGSCLLVAGLSFLALRFAAPRRQLEPRSCGSLLAMATRNAALNPGRSLLSACLVASASFVIVAASANGFRYSDEVRALDSPGGGYTLMAEADIPLHADLGDPDALFDLGFADFESEMVGSMSVTAFRVLPGDDVSCLNLYQPESPRVLGVPAGQVERGGFPFQQVLRETDDPWSLLEADFGDVVPAFADHESALWIMKIGLGEDLFVVNERGEKVALRLVGLFENGLFQSEVLISEEHFKEHFPSRSGYSFFLLDPPVGASDETAEILERRLSAYGFDVTPTRERLQRFRAVRNTYLATFQTLGGLGLLLGTLGLAAILLRNVVERRGELATLRALGFKRESLGWLVVAENVFLLVFGVAVGTGSALVAVAPHLVQGNALVPWTSLILTLLVIVAVGMLACTAAVRGALRAPLLPALKAE